MDGKILVVAVLIVTMMPVLDGCGGDGGPAQGGDAESELARRIVDAVYSGSMGSVQDSLHPDLKHLMPDHVMGAASAALREQFGEVLSVERHSRESAASAQGAREAVWTVRAQRAPFEMRISRDADGTVTGIWFREPSARQWSTAVDLAKDYARRMQGPVGR